MKVNAFINRSINIMVNPKTEWEHIANENFPIRSITLNFVLPYLIMDFISSMLGCVLFSSKNMIYPLKFAFVQSVTSFLVYIIILYITPVFIQLIGISFNIQINRENAFKLIAYSFTPVFIIGIIVGLIPALGVIDIVGLYAFYIMWHGYDMMLNITDKKTFFYIISVLIIIAEYILLGAMFIQLFI